MGLFGRKQEGPSSLSDIEALAGIALTAIYSDGVYAADEDALLQSYFGTLKRFRDASQKELDAAFAKVYAMAEELGEEKLMDACAAALPERLRATGFIVAADLLLADQEFATAEREYLARLQKALAIDEPTAAKVLEVIAMRHRT